MRLIPKFFFSALVAGAAMSTSAATYSDLVVFGDSLSDPGNALLLTGGILLTPSNGHYVDAQGHFSNGKTAAEYLANALGVTTTLGWSAAGGNNYAVGGALAGTGHLDDASVPSLVGTGVASQIAKYAPSAGFSASSTLFLVQGGANDMTRAFDYAAAHPMSAQDSYNYFSGVINSVTNDLVGDIVALGSKGARNILWYGLPDLGLTPAAAYAETLVPGFAANASALSASFNQVLALKIAGADASMDAMYGTDVKLMGVDLAGFLQAQYANPVLNMTTSCVSPVNNALPGCSGLFFYDSIHPTTAAHQLLAAELIAAAVPEPETWAMLIVGLGLMAAAARRRQARD